MSLPRELLDELLSAYMDGELSADERARVEQMLATDPAVRDALQLLEEQSQSVRHSLRNAPRLDEDFAERVLAATFAEAERLSLEPSHPVRRAAGGMRTEPTPHRYRHRYMAGGLAIAASLAMAAIFLADGDSESIVAIDPPPGPSVPEVVEDLAGLGQSTAVASDLDEPSGASTNSDPSQIADSGQLAGGPQLTDAGPQGVSSAGTTAPDAMIAQENTAQGDSRQDSSEPGRPAGVPGSVDPSMLADVGEVPASDLLRDGSTNAPPAGNPSAQHGQVPLRAVLVYQVQLTPVGRERGVINRALRDAQIRAANQRAVDETLVGYLRSGGMIGEAPGQEGADDAGISIMYLEGPGRRLEKLMLSLLAASEEVQSVGFSLAMEPPVMSAVDSLRQINPRDIRSDGIEAVAHTLSLGSNLPGGGRFTAGDRSFLPLQQDALEMLSTMGSPSESDQPDITASTFLIIR